jgi:hypothetical protein
VKTGRLADKRQEDQEKARRNALGEALPFRALEQYAKIRNF